MARKQTCHTALHMKDGIVYSFWLYTIHWSLLHLIFFFICVVFLELFLPFIMAPRRKSDSGDKKKAEEEAFEVFVLTPHTKECPSDDQTSWYQSSFGTRRNWVLCECMYVMALEVHMYGHCVKNRLYGYDSQPLCPGKPWKMIQFPKTSIYCKSFLFVTEQ